MHNLSDQFASLTGEKFITALRALAILSKEDGGRVRCGATECTNEALFIGMQRCGTPGGPICQVHLEQHRAWMDTADAISNAAPYCRHCGQDVDRSHIYAVNIWDGKEVEL